MNKYEKLIEYIINDEEDKARELFHTILVKKSREIYESIVDEQDLAEVGGNEVEDLMQDVQMDEEGISEEEDEADDLDMDMDMGDEGEEDHHADVGGDEAIEDRVMDLEDALDELKAEFDALMAGDEQDTEDADMFGGDEGEEAAPEEFYEAEEDEELEESAQEDDEDDEEELDETIVREYVEKVSAPSNKTEGGEVGKAGSANINKSSIVAGKNDMGGSAANINKGGAEQAPDGTSATKKPSNQYTKGQGNLKGAGNFENVPGAKAGNAFAKKESAVKKEQGGVVKHSPVAK